MAAKLYATLLFSEEDIKDLLRENVASQGYYVNSVEPSDDTPGEISVAVRPMTPEERVLHDLPLTSVEDRLQDKMDALLADATNVFAEIHAELRAETLDRVDSMREMGNAMLSVLEQMQVAAEKAAHPVRAVTPRHSTPSWEDEDEDVGPVRQAPYRAPDRPARRVEREEAVAEPAAPLSFKSLSFADAAADLQKTSASSNPSERTRQERFTKLHITMAKEALEAEEEEEREYISGEVEAFPADRVTK